MMSPNSLAITITEPASSASVSIVFLIEISRSDADKVSFPSSCSSSMIPFRIGIVVREVTALDTMVRAFDNFCCSHMNFIITSGFFYMLFIFLLVVIVVGPVDSVEKS